MKRKTKNFIVAFIVAVILSIIGFILSSTFSNDMKYLISFWFGYTVLIIIVSREIEESTAVSLLW